MGQDVLRGAATDVRKEGLIAVFGRGPVPAPQTEQLIQRPIFFPCHGLCQVKPMARDDAQSRVAGIRRRSGAQSAKSDRVRNQQCVPGIGFRSIDVGLAKALHDTGIDQELLGVPAAQDVRLRQRLKERAVVDRGRFQAHGQPRAFAGLGRYPPSAVIAQTTCSAWLTSTPINRGFAWETPPFSENQRRDRRDPEREQVAANG